MSCYHWPVTPTSSPHQQFSFKSKSNKAPKNRVLGAILEFLGAVKMAVKLRQALFQSLYWYVYFQLSLFDLS